MEISEFLSVDRVVPRLGAPNRRHVLRELAHITAKVSSLDPGKVYAALLEHEESTTIGLGRGTAVPHAPVEGLTAPLGAFVRLKPAIDFGAVDGEPVDLVFMVLAPVGDERTLLRAMSSVARRLRVPDLAARLRSASDADALYSILVSDAWMGEGGPGNRGLARAVAAE